ncbi:hypothetical protein FB567DRAFT_431044 [Paraphoma chrysanthemicola]|uniref:RING-type domain-containing protein n=1 Tax=Paraphoma chrysanthemicola TaxID=798071 RepID=A0A8K0W5G3_9PLEO|nr:hypothetical protein FB567DRAFT_431044 [Paraphoma chrysanthemicola]
MANEARLPYNVVDLASDSEDEVLSGDEMEFFDAQSERQGPLEELPNMNARLDELGARNNPTYADGVIDLTAIPDIDVPPSDDMTALRAGPANQSGNEGPDLVSETICLQMVLDVLPDISIDHVLNLIRDTTTDATRTVAQCENIITGLLDGEAYPKEADEAKNKKRKRTEEDDWKEYEQAERNPEVPTYESDAADLLKDEFLFVPVRHITNILKEHKTLFKSYLVLEEQVRNYGRIANTNLFSRIGKARIKRGIEFILIERGSQIPKELHAAKSKVVGEMLKRHEAEEAEQAEKANFENAQRNNELGQCACCFDDVPLNRMIACNGDTTHFYCFECPRQQVETQMGQSKCRPVCFGVTDCIGTFTRRQLQQVLGEKTFERLEHLQQMEDLAAAGLDFLSECPFCDFKMECPPVEVDKEFRCQSKKCGKTSCRLCDKETHIPLTCKEADKEGQITLRHIVEEAMSAALIRQCNNCKHPFVKEYGCNKMTCSHCRNVQCYVCSKNVVNYDHFGEAATGKCPLHENVEDRHEQEVKKAADEAMAKVRADNPHLSDADLMIKVSDKVKQVEDARKGRAQVQAQAFPYHMVNDQLRHRAPPVMPQPPRRIAQVMPPPAQYVPGPPFAPAPFPVHVQPQQPFHAVQPPPYANHMGAAPQQLHQYVCSCRHPTSSSLTHPQLPFQFPCQARPLPVPYRHFQIPPTLHYHC